MTFKVGDIVIPKENVHTFYAVTNRLVNMYWKVIDVQKVGMCIRACDKDGKEYLLSND